MNLPTENPWLYNTIENQIANNNELSLNKSGNSDVDVNVNVEVDTKAIAYAMLISLFKTNQITRTELNEAVDDLDGFIERSKRRRGQSRPWFNK